MCARQLKDEMRRLLKTNRAPLTLLYFVALVLLVLHSVPVPAQTASGRNNPASGSNPAFANIDGIMQQAVDRGNIPGGVVLVGHNGSVVYRKAFGSRSLEPTREPMSVDTIFDLASLTKCIATTTAVMQLFEDGRIRLNDTVATYLPEFKQNGKDQI